MKRVDLILIGKIASSNIWRQHLIIYAIKILCGQANDIQYKLLPFPVSNIAFKYYNYMHSFSLSPKVNHQQKILRNSWLHRIMREFRGRYWTGSVAEPLWWASCVLPEMQLWVSQCISPFRLPGNIDETLPNSQQQVQKAAVLVSSQPFRTPVSGNNCSLIWVSTYFTHPTMTEHFIWISYLFTLFFSQNEKLRLKILPN